MKPQQRNQSRPLRVGLIVASLDIVGGHAVQARRTELAGLMRQRFPAESSALIAEAEKILAGRFDLLGLEDLSFGNPPDWHLEPLSGKRAPLIHWSRIDYLDPQIAGDKKITWELSRHGYFITLGQAYLLTGDERFAATFAAHAQSWLDANQPRRGINWASSLEVALRAIAWLWALRLFARSPHLTPQLLRRMHKSLALHGRHIARYLSEYFSPNTHLTGEALGLFYLGVAMPELLTAKAWRGTGLKILLAQLPRQTREDGVYFEQATYYHRYTTDFYLHLLLLSDADQLRLPALFSERLSLLLDHLMWITQPDGTSPLIGDDDGGRLIRFSPRASNDFRETLATGAALFGRGDWKAVAGDAAVELLWLLGPEGLHRYDQIVAQTVKQQARAFPEGGYYVMRDGWTRESAFALIDGGPHGALSCGHAHADALSLEFAAGETWLIDPGTYTYTGDARWRDYFRSTAAHNTVTVDGLSQSEMKQTFRWNSAAETGVSDFFETGTFTFFSGSHNGYERLSDPVTHTRSVIMVKAEAAAPTYLLVRDQMKATATHQYAIRWHFPAGCSARTENGSVMAEAIGNHQLLIQTISASACQARIEPGRVSQAYGQADAAPAAMFETVADGPQDFLSLIIPASCLIEPVIKTPQLRGFRIVCGTVVDFWMSGQNGQTAVERDRAADSLFCERYIRDRLERLCLINGHELKTDSGFGFHSPTGIRYCAVQFAQERIDIALDGADRFALTFAQPVSLVFINGERLVLNRQQQHASFVYDGIRWQVARE
jgi:hypothetical protein